MYVQSHNEASSSVSMHSLHPADEASSSTICVYVPCAHRTYPLYVQPSDHKPGRQAGRQTGRRTNISAPIHHHRLTLLSSPLLRSVPRVSNIGQVCNNHAARSSQLSSFADTHIVRYIRARMRLIFERKISFPTAPLALSAGCVQGPGPGWRIHGNARLDSLLSHPHSTLHTPFIGTRLRTT